MAMPGYDRVLTSLGFSECFFFLNNFLTSVPPTKKSHDLLSHYKMIFQNHLCLDCCV